MNIKKLFTGVGVIIDDKVNETDDKQDRIVKIVNYLERECKIPLVKYADIPDVEIIEHCSSINFILLDWSLIELPLTVSAPEIKMESHKKILNFLSQLQEKCCSPVFLFSNEDIEDIRKEVFNNGISKLPILFRSKSELFNSDEKILLFELLEDWINKHSGVYVTKEWYNTFNKAYVDFLSALNKTNAHWPKAICKSADSDSTDVAEEISDLIVQNILSRMEQHKYDLEQIKKDTKIVQQEDIKKIIEKQRYCTAGYTYDSTGDFYEKEGSYYLNIRPVCDCIPRDDFDNKLHLLKCIPHGIKDNFDEKYGNYHERDNEAVIGPINGGKLYSVCLNKLYLCDINEMKGCRKGRLLPPFITRVAQKYGLYVQRQGLPRIPIEAVYSPKEIEEKNIEQDEKAG